MNKAPEIEDKYKRKPATAIPNLNRQVCSNIEIYT